MISKGNFEKEHIQEQIKQYPKVDPAKMEMTIFAFGLLDELIRCGLSLIFKGGTSMLLLLDNPKRANTDIDIIAPAGLAAPRDQEQFRHNLWQNLISTLALGSGLI